MGDLKLVKEVIEDVAAPNQNIGDQRESVFLKEFNSVMIEMQ